MNSKNSTSRSTSESSTMKGCKAYRRHYGVMKLEVHGFISICWFTCISKQTLVKNMHLTIEHSTTYYTEIPF